MLYSANDLSTVIQNVKNSLLLFPCSHVAVYFNNSDFTPTPNPPGYVSAVSCNTFSEFDECSREFIFDHCNIYTNMTDCSKGQTALRCEGRQQQFQNLLIPRFLYKSIHLFSILALSLPNIINEMG